MSVPLKIGTWNVNGIRARLDEVQAWVTKERPDILCLQEIKASPYQIPMFLCELDDYWCYWHGSKGYSGVGLLVRKEFAPERPAFAHPGFDFEHRIVTVRTPQATVASVYVPNGGKDFPAKMRFLEALDEFAAAYRADGLPLVICGDLNVARTDADVHPKERKPRATGQRPEERALIERIISHELVDVGRALDPDNDMLFTWWAPWREMRQRNIGWRLDYVLASRSLFASVRGATVEREFGTSIARRTTGRSRHGTRVGPRTRNGTLGRAGRTQTSAST
jgi:exodeoxyribonuclease-3